MKTEFDEKARVAAERRALNRIFATITFSPDRKVIRANNYFTRLFGFTSHEITGQHEGHFFPDENMPDEVEEFWKNIDAADSLVCDHRWLKNDGQEVWIKARYTVLRDNDHQIIEVVKIISDATISKMRAAEERGQIDALNASFAVAHFSLDGTIVSANDLLCDIVGYSQAELIGHHHCILLNPDQAQTDDYRSFWQSLSNGASCSGEFQRVCKDGSEVWLNATYNTVLDPSGTPMKVVKYATDITAEKRKKAEYEWQLTAVHKSQCVISFDMHGTILDANDLFLEASGYSLSEIQGRHHRMFLEPSASHSTEYAQFWLDLQKGNYRSGQYERVVKGGRKVWLQATYNPVFDLQGNPYKVVKYASVVTDARLQQAEHEGQIAAIHKAQCVISFDLDGIILDANDNFLQAVGYKYSEVRGNHHNMFVDAEYAKSEEYKSFWARLKAGEYFAGEYKRLTQDGSEVWLQATYSPIFDMSGRPFKVVKYATDITQEKLSRADIKGQIEAINRSQMVATLDLNGQILNANGLFLETFGYQAEEIIGKHHEIFVQSETSSHADYATFWETLRAGKFHSGMYQRICKDGSVVWIQATYNPILDIDDKPVKVIKFATNVSENVALAEAYEDAKRQALHDPVTSLPNRNRLSSFLTTQMEQLDKQLVVLYLDLDHFKPVNDTYGHAVGDKVLCDISDRVRRILRGDQMVARVGGDEFVVVLPDLAINRIERVCQKIISAVEAPIYHDHQSIRVSTSIGIAIAPNDGETPDEILRAADTALYKSKASGRGAFSFYASEQDQEFIQQRKMVVEMQKAIEQDEFFLEFQPRFDTRNNTINSMEALVRWQHPENGRIPPFDFIPLAEASGLIKPLGAWVLKQACLTAQNWPNIGVSVNVSPAQLRAGNLSEIVQQTLDETQLPAEMLELEVTEGVLIEDADFALVELNKIKALGVKLAIDDFGTGYSSLSYLRNYPFDVIKIDRQFVSDLKDNADGRPIVQAIVRLAHTLGLSITAEGVETDEQLAILTLDRCDEVQGYLLAMPLSADKIDELLQEMSQPMQTDFDVPKLVASQSEDIVTNQSA